MSVPGPHVYHCDGTLPYMIINIVLIAFRCASGSWDVDGAPLPCVDDIFSNLNEKTEP